MLLRKLLSAVVILALIGLGAGWVLSAPHPLPADALAARTADVDNGRTMFNAGGCSGCHATVGQPDRLRLGGGLALKSPFGTFKVPNISSDPKAGIGAWSELQFVNALLRGVGDDGQHLYPAFPYTSYQRMMLTDARDLYAFLKTVPANSRPSEPHEIAFPFNIRRAIGLWKLLYFDGRAFVPDPTKSAELNRGAYLVEGPGHCAECHSRRNLLGAIPASARFAGGPEPGGTSWVPNITPDADGLAKWSAKDIEFVLQTGLTPDGVPVGGSMAEVVKSTSLLSPADRQAMAAYVKSLPPRPGKRPPKSPG